jgi:hypothetical protein
VRCECKEEGVSSSLNLNSDRERGEGKQQGAAAGGLAIGGRRALREVGPGNGRAKEGGGARGLTSH